MFPDKMAPIIKEHTYWPKPEEPPKVDPPIINDGEDGRLPDSAMRYNKSLARKSEDVISITYKFSKRENLGFNAYT